MDVSLRLNRVILLRFYGLITFINLFVIFCSRGPIEGDARNLGNLDPGSDWFGPIPPLIYGGWPISGENWDLTLSLLQVTFFCLGYFLLLDIKKRYLGYFEYFSQLSIYWVGMLFCSQLWRDATLLAFVILGLGLIKFAIQSKFRLKIMFFIFGLLFIIVGACCKYIYSPIIALLLLILMKNAITFNKKVIAGFILIFLFVSTAPYLLNNAISTSLGLRKSFPEQQPIIFDLTSIYCWGSSEQSNKQAIEYLRVAKKIGFPDESICSSLEPTGWDTLRTDRPKWEYSSPLSPLMNERSVQVMIRNWLKLILNNPQEYIEVKIIHSTQVLLMANAIGPRTNRSSNFFPGDSIFNKISQFFTWPPRIMDKLRLFSVGFVLLVTSTLLARIIFARRSSLLQGLREELGLASLLLCLLSQIIITTISFVSSNGRYSFPFTLLILIFILNVLSDKSSRTRHEL
jgi:hypothetical protein